jgi:hypothetical protein
MKHKNLLLLPLLTLLLVCCKHKEDPLPPHDPHTSRNCQEPEFNEIDNSLTQQFLFKAGTYWVYKDSINNTIDSCYCSGSGASSGTYTINPTMPGQGSCTIQYTYETNYTNQPDSFQYTYYIQYKSIRLLTPFGFPSAFLCSDNSGSLKGDSLSLFYPAITINGVSYNNVYKFHFQASYGKYRDGYFYLKPGLGIIKTLLYTYELYPSRTAHVNELLRYHIQ